MSARFALAAAALALGTSCSAAPPEAMQSAPATFAEWQARCASAGDGRESWVVPAPPFRIHGDTYYVGTCGITALLVASPEGHVLLDTGMPGAAALVAANVEALGFAVGDIAWLLSSHEHLDHVGATAELKRLSGGQAAALAVARQPLESGLPYPHDPQAAIIPPFEGFAIDRVLADGEVLQAGPHSFTIHSTPAHTPGSASWSWQSCEDGECLTIAYADSLTTPAAEDYRFSDHSDYSASLRAGFTAVAAMPCDILLTPHPGASAMVPRPAGDTPLVDPQGCRAYGDDAARRFAERLAREEAEAR